MKFPKLPQLFILFAIAYGLVAHAAPGELDPTFAKGGVLDLAAASGRRIPAYNLDYPPVGQSILIAKSGSLYVGGGYRGSSFVARILTNGALDRSFSADGLMIRTGFNTSYSATDTIVETPSGRIVTSDSFVHECGVLCPPGIPESGRLIDSFGVAGKVAPKFVDGISMGMPLTTAAVFSNGGVVGLNRNFSLTAPIIARAFRADGFRDISFEQNANQVFYCPPASNIYNIFSRVDHQDRLVVAVNGDPGVQAGQSASCVFRLLRDGRPDPSFGIGGAVRFSDVITPLYKPADIAITPEGGLRIAIIPASGQFINGAAKAGQIRLTAAGALDGRFAEGAIVTFDTPFIGIVGSILPLANGDTLVTGLRAMREFIVPFRVLSDGSPGIAHMRGAVRNNRFGSSTDGVASLLLPENFYDSRAPRIATTAGETSIFLLEGVGTKIAKLQSLTTDAAPRYDGLWWRNPAGSESGWGINIAHQGNIIFATWYTYDTNNNPMWLVMPRMELDARGKFVGSIYRTASAPSPRLLFDSAAVITTLVGSASFDFTGGSDGIFAYAVDGITQSKSITRQAFGALPRCTTGGAPSAQAHYQGLWWNAPANSEPGWGINLSHQSDTLFATWFTYDVAGSPTWLVMSDGTRTADLVPTYRGTLYKTSGPAFAANPWRASDVSVNAVGQATFSFPDANTAQFSGSVDGVATVKKLTRQIFSIPLSDCQ